MALTVLIAICLFACAFYLYVLFQWMRDKKREPTGRPAIGEESGKTGHKKQPRSFNSRKRQTPKGSSSGCTHCEGIAYERITRSLRLRNSR